jgi:hypothetical protein
MSGKLLFSAMIGLSGALACSRGGSSGAYKPVPQPVKLGTLQVFGGGSERLSHRFYAGRNAYRSWCPDTSGRASADRIFFSNGMTAQRIGNTWFFSDGSTAQRIGNFTFFGDGTTATHIGNFTFFSDGSTAHRMGNVLFYND